MTIRKFPLEITDEQTITVPLVNCPLCVQVQYDEPCLWMAVDPEAKSVSVKVMIFGTGHEGVSGDMDYIGTFQMRGGALVFHVFLAGVAASA